MGIYFYGILYQRRANIYLNGPKRTIVIMLVAEQFNSKQKTFVVINPCIGKNFSINLHVTLKY